MHKKYYTPTISVTKFTITDVVNAQNADVSDPESSIHQPSSSEVATVPEDPFAF